MLYRTTASTRPVKHVTSVNETLLTKQLWDQKY